MQNPVLTGLRGVGKTVLLETFKPLAHQSGWLWVGTDMSESASVSEANLLTRLITDVAVISYSFTARVEGSRGTEEHSLDNAYLMERCNAAPGLMSDKLRAILELLHQSMPQEYKGIVFAYDEAQNLSDHADDNEYPLSLLLEVFQSVQRRNIPFMLLLTGLPTLVPKLVAARTYAERMFKTLFLERLDEDQSKEAITRPLKQFPIQFSNDSVDLIYRKSGGYPYFIQFICRELFDVYLVQHARKEKLVVPMRDIVKRLDKDFFAGRWTNASDRQRELMHIIAELPNSDGEFSVKEIAAASKNRPDIKPFSSSHINQMLGSLATAGLVFKNRYGKYSFAVPLLNEFINRQDDIS